jgi:hypothetical protein
MRSMLSSEESTTRWWLPFWFQLHHANCLYFDDTKPLPSSIMAPSLLLARRRYGKSSRSSLEGPLSTLFRPQRKSNNIRELESVFSDWNTLGLHTHRYVAIVSAERGNYSSRSRLSSWCCLRFWAIKVDVDVRDNMGPQQAESSLRSLPIRLLSRHNWVGASY